MGLSSTPLNAPFGSGTPLTVRPTPKPATEAAYIDPDSRDYVVDSDGDTLRMPRTRQRVLLSASTRRGSATADAALGVRMPPKVGSDFVRSVSESVRAAVDPVGEATDVSVLVDIERPGRVTVTIPYTDSEQS